MQKKTEAQLERRREYQRKWRVKPENYAKIKARRAVFRAENYERIKEKERRLQKERRLKNNERLAGRIKPTICEIHGCGNTNKICFDHDHKTGMFRGWICEKCNFILGLVGDDPEVLIELSSYLRVHNEKINS